MSSHERPVPGKTSNIFISYRREDAAGHAGRLYDRLAAHFGGDRTFMDVDTIKPGEDFVSVIEEAVGSCQVLLAIIGREWLASSDGNTRRLDNPNDFVRIEIETALKRNVRVIPVLVEDATMPLPQQLPESLRGLTRRNAIELSDARWAFDVGRLIDAIKQVLPKAEDESPPPVVTHDKPAAATRRMLMIIGAVLIIGLAIVVAVISQRWNNSNNDNAAQSSNPSGQTLGNTSSPTVNKPERNVNGSSTSPTPTASSSPNVSPSSATPTPSPKSAENVDNTLWKYTGGTPSGRGQVVYTLHFEEGERYFNGRKGMLTFTDSSGRRGEGGWSQRGVRIEFNLNDRYDQGVITGNTMTGNGKGDTGLEYEWSATKINSASAK